MKLIKVAVAMSGGVDSSVVAALMVKKYGKENVFGVTAKFFCYSGESSNPKACCSLEAIDDARLVCEKIGIPHYVINEEKKFEQAVVKNFIEAYRHGQTPIPCIPCNTVVKFGSMLKKVKELGADKLATGHYAITEEGRVNNEGGLSLLRGVDRSKDQSYFLYGLNQQQLASVEFPIGEMTKTEVRQIAKKLGLKTAEKKESQGVCFVTEGRVTDYLADKIDSKQGRIIDTNGKILGEHGGYIFYTIGQRKRIGGGYDKPMFVTAINPLENEVVIGTKDDLYKKELVVGKIHWINKMTLPLSCTAKIRYNMKDDECVVSNQSSRNLKSQTSNYVVTFKEPQRAITPGQSIVFYDGDICLGGGIIG